MEGNRAVESNPGLEPVGSIIGHSRTFADLIQEKTHFQRLYEQEKSRCHFLYERYAKYYMAKL